MADFCTRCAKEMGFSTPDIDLIKEFEDLKEGNYSRFLCEGCGYMLLAKKDGVNRITTLEDAIIPPIDEWDTLEGFIKQLNNL